jgi:hypothetical protein
MTDEVGCKIRHSQQPNCRMVPFHTPRYAYSLLWPVRDIAKDGKVLEQFYLETLQKKII